MASLVDLLSARYAPIQQSMLSYLGVPEVLALTSTCKALRCIQNRLQTTSYNIDRALQPFFKNPHEFRSIQAKHDALIGGRFARSFFTRQTGGLSILDLYVTNSKLGALLRYLIHEGYETTYVFPTAVHYYFKAKGRNEERQIRLIRCKSAPLATILDNADTTAYLHLISWNKAYSLFPFTTFLRQEAYLVKEMTETVSESCADLTEEGIRTKAICWKQWGLGGDCEGITCRRRVGDKHTWVINLDIRGIIPSKVADAVAETSTFQLSVRFRDEFEDPSSPITAYMIRFQTLSHPLLRNQFIALHECDEVDEDHDECPVFCERYRQLFRRLEETAYIEIMKVHYSKRPARLYDFEFGVIDAQEVLEDFTIAPTWTYYDDDVTEYLMEAWNEQCKIDEAERMNRS